MSDLFDSNEVLPLNDVPGYKGAYFGFLHVAFLADDGLFYLDEEDRKPIAITEDLYKKRLSRVPSFPYGKDRIPGTEKRALKKILGLPDAIFDHLDFSKDLLSQLHFREGLLSLKKDCYFTLFARYRKKWFLDDFKLYLLSQGLYFPIDETKKFIALEGPAYPVLFDESSLAASTKEDYEAFSIDKIVIEILGKTCDRTLYDYLKRYDGRSLNDLLSYFVCHIPDESLQALATDSYKDDILARAVRRYVASIVNRDYDDYSRRRLNAVTGKLSYLSVRKASDQDILSVSSYMAEMYSVDGGKTYAFDPSDKKRIAFLFKDALAKDESMPPALLYAQLGLPYAGFREIDGPELKAKDLLKKLPFLERALDKTTLFLSIKRYDVSYCYAPGTPLHFATFIKRRLLDQGVFYHERQDGTDHRVMITVFPSKRSEELRKLFDRPTCSLVDRFYFPYLVFRSESAIPALFDTLKALDERSSETAVSYFYNSFSDNTIKEAVDDLFAYFHMEKGADKDVYDFFTYVLGCLLTIGADAFRKEALREGDGKALAILDGLPKRGETFEPDLPYPYVEYGLAFYSFRKDFFSSPYLCSCQKKAVDDRIEYYGRLFDRIHRDEGEDERGQEEETVERNAFILQRLGVPDNVLQRVDCRKDIGPQIHYMDHLCHLCNASIPTYHEVIADSPLASKNTFFSYVRAIGSTKGVYLGELENEEDVPNFFFDQIFSGEYHGLLDYDETKVEPSLVPYLHPGRRTLMAIFSTFYSEMLEWPKQWDDLSNAVRSDDSFLQNLLLDTVDSIDAEAMSMPFVMTKMALFYNRLAVAYCYKVSKPLLPTLDVDTYVDTIYVPGLEYPYVLLGRLFNAYGKTPDGPFYFCSCDYKAMRDVLYHFASSFAEEKLDPDLLSAAVLGMSGLPFQMVLRFASFGVTTSNVDELLSHFPFRDHICARCQGVSIPSISPYFPFSIALPGKENKVAEFVSIRNRMAKDGFLLPYSYFPEDLRFDPSYKYALRGDVDRKIPYFYFFRYNVKGPVESFFVLGEEKLSQALKDYLRKVSDTYARKACLLIQEEMKKNPRALMKIVEENGMGKNLRTVLTEAFPKAQTVSKEDEMVLHRILGFVTYRSEKLIDYYILQEDVNGR